jgi:hypothetical protein
MILVFIGTETHAPPGQAGAGSPPQPHEPSGRSEAAQTKTYFGPAREQWGGAAFVPWLQSNGFPVQNVEQSLGNTERVLRLHRCQQVLA